MGHQPGASAYDQVVGAHWWSSIGLFLDAIGAVLLSVEAVKLENIRRFRRRVHDSTQLFRWPLPWSPRASPQGGHSGRLPWGVTHFVFGALGLAAVLGIAHLLNVPLDQLVPAMRRWFGHGAWVVLGSYLTFFGLGPWIALWRGSVVILLATLVVAIPTWLVVFTDLSAATVTVPLVITGIVLTALFFVAEFVIHVLLQRLILGSAVNLLDVVDRNTPSGTIGLVGLLFLLAGFAGQAIGVWAGRV